MENFAGHYLPRNYSKRACVEDVCVLLFTVESDTLDITSYNEISVIKRQRNTGIGATIEANIHNFWILC